MGMSVFPSSVGGGLSIPRENIFFFSPPWDLGVFFPPYLDELHLVSLEVLLSLPPELMDVGQNNFFLPCLFFPDEHNLSLPE